MNTNMTKAWEQYEAGKAYKRRIGLYERVRQNERFYRGDQWFGSQAAAELPKPVFNVIRRVVDYLICSVAAGRVSVSYTGDRMPFLSTGENCAALMQQNIDMLNRHAAYRWEKCGMDRMIYQLLTDAAISGDGVLYSYWDPDIDSGQAYGGDIATVRVDSTELFLADVNRADIQSQAYVMLSGRERVSRLREEAKRYGADTYTISCIVPDDVSSEAPGDMNVWELEGDEEAKATYLIKFWREKGKVVFEKSVRGAVIRRVRTDMTYYPVAYFNWYPTKGSFHGTSPITGLIPNQKYINRAYGMVMKHLTDTAFSKVVYDKSRIPEWSNKVGEAIAAVGAVNVSDAVSVVGVGKMQEGYLELISNVISQTKEMMGATDIAMGNVISNNTGAIVALQDAARIPLEQVRCGFYHCLEDLANIWADMMCAYYPSGRLLPYRQAESVGASAIDIDLIKNAMLRAKVEVVSVSGYSTAAVVNVLDRLLDGGHITAQEYIARLPDGILPDREALLAERSYPERAENTGDSDAPVGKEKAQNDASDKNMEKRKGE